MEQVEGKRQTLRRPVVNAVVAVPCMLGAFALVGAAQLVDAAHGLVAAALIGALALLVLWVGVRFMLMRVVLTDANVVIHNLWRDYRVPWANIVRLVPSTVGFAPRPIGIQTVSGRVVRFTGISPGRAEPKSVSDKWFDILERAYLLHGPGTHA